VNREFHKANPEQAARLIIAELKVVNRGHYRSGEHPYAVWCIRALRRLTGKDFKARTRSKLSENEINFLQPDEAGRIRFFGTWMSRDSVDVAPG